MQNSEKSFQRRIYIEGTKSCRRKFIFINDDLYFILTFDNDHSQDKLLIKLELPHLKKLQKLDMVKRQKKSLDLNSSVIIIRLVRELNSSIKNLHLSDILNGDENGEKLFLCI